MIVDTFMFFNELDLLDVRLRELEHVVDKFVLVESGHTLAGTKKPYFFEENKRRFDRFLPRIEHVKLAGLPPLATDTEKGRFWLEAFQRNSILNGLINLALDPDTVILISDVDEIPSRGAVLYAADNTQNAEIMTFKQRIYYHAFDQTLTCEVDKVKDFWLGTIAVRYRTLGEILPNDLRLYSGGAARFGVEGESQPHNRMLIDNGGWHLTYFGGDNVSRYKMVNFAHGAANIYGKPTDHKAVAIERASMSGLRAWSESLNNDLSQIIFSQLEGNIPNSIKENLREFYHHFKSSYQ